MTNRLEGFGVAVFETRHAKAMADLVRLQGGIPVCVPSLKEVPIEDNPQVLLFGEKLIAGEVDVLILLTGVGTRALMEVLEKKYERNAVLEALRNITIVPRGPKPIRVLKEWDVPFALTVPEPNTWRELIAELDRFQVEVPLAGRRVCVQEYGIPNPDLVAALVQRKAIVQTVSVYKWSLPDDTTPLKNCVRALIAQKLDVVLFTTAVQVEHLFQIAQTLGLTQELKMALGHVVVASVGPDCSEAIRSKGVGVDIEPESPKMGPLAQELALKAAAVRSDKKNHSQNQEITHPKDPLKDSLFLKACRREKVSTTPVWLLRQAGRYMKDYRAIRDKVSFLDLCQSPDLVTEVTVHAQEYLGADAAIIFSDILLIVEPMGFKLSYLANHGPSISEPVCDRLDVRKIQNVDVRQGMDYVYRAIRQTRHALKPSIPLIGFAGAPFTLASYLIEGGPASPGFARTRELMQGHTQAWHELLEKITRYTTDYLNCQIEAGVQAVQLFDSWVGVLSAKEYAEFVHPYTLRVVQSITSGVPVILFGTKTGHLLELMREAQAEVMGVDASISLTEAWNKIGTDRAIQGNLDPLLLARGSWPEIKQAAEKILTEVAGRPGHIFNLGHGILPETPEKNARDLIDFVHSFKQ